MREFLRGYAGDDGERQARCELDELFERADARSGSRGRRWTRDELYDDRLGRHG